MSKVINAANTFTDPVQPGRGFDLSLYANSSFSGTLTLQRRRVGETNWRDVKTYTGPAEEYGQSSGNWEYRLGCKTGNYTSGSITAEVSA